MGFFFHEMAFGLLSIFLPLYVVNSHIGSLVDVGLLSAASLFLAIPASFFWGYMCDKTRRYKRYVLLSFVVSSVFLYLFTLATSMILLIILYAAMSLFHVGHEAPKNVLIAESYSREDWERSFAFYEGFTEIGWLIGLFLGFVLSNFGFSPVNTLLVVVGLNLLAFVLSVFLVADPILIFERRLVGIEKTMNYAFHGISLASKLLDGIPSAGKLRRERVGVFCLGLVLFSLATSILFTPMPIFVSGIVSNAALPAGIVFLIFVLNSGGGVAGYVIARRRSNGGGERASLSGIVIFRSLLSLLLIGVMALPLMMFNVSLVTLILVLFGFANALFLVHILSLSMELIPAGKAGLFNVLVGVGAAAGSFVGPFVAQTFGFIHVFAAAAAIFFLAFLAFKLYA
jgi:MFS family permease